MIAAIGTAAASSNDTFAGFRTRRTSRAGAYSAQAAPDVPNTSSPGLNSVTSFPTASTTPATSAPTLVLLGLRRPPPNSRTKYGAVTPYHSTGLADDACTRSSTWSSAIAGMSTSRSSSTSGMPNRSWTIAFIVLPGRVVVCS